MRNIVAVSIGIMAVNGGKTHCILGGALNREKNVNQEESMCMN